MSSTTIFTIKDSNLPQAINLAIREIEDARLIAMPTETVYGLAGDATNPHAVATIYAVKGRPGFNPLISHVGTLDQARSIGQFNETAELLATHFWPGPMTLIVPRHETGTVCDLATAGLETLAIRIPAHPFANQLLTQLDKPLAAPSANRSGHVSASRADHVVADFSEQPLTVFDDGASHYGVESTIISVIENEITLLRHGAIALEDIEGVLEQSIDQITNATAKPLAPGQLSSHYAPECPVRLNASVVAPDEALLAFGPQVPSVAKSCRAVINLSETGDTREAAANLFQALRSLEMLQPKSIACMTIPMTGLGAAINDRLARAAAPKL